MTSKSSYNSGSECDAGAPDSVDLADDHELSHLRDDAEGLVGPEYPPLTGFGQLALSHHNSTRVAMGAVRLSLSIKSTFGASLKFCCRRQFERVSS